MNPAEVVIGKVQRQHRSQVLPLFQQVAGAANYRFKLHHDMPPMRLGSLKIGSA